MEVDLVLSGSGTRFPIFIGALKAFEENDIQIKRVAGTSGGSIMASYIALQNNTTADEMFKTILDMDFKKFKDFSILSLIFRYGVYKGNEVEKTVDKIMGGITFKYLPMSCKIVASNPMDDEIVVFSKETTPDVKVSAAVRYSLSVPLVFGYKKYKEKPLLDGLLVSNYPIDIFDDNQRKVFGFRIVSSTRKTCCFSKMSIFDYTIYLVQSLILSLEKEHMKDAPLSASTIEFDCDINPLNFDLTKGLKQKMFDIGYKTTKQYLLSGEHNA